MEKQESAILLNRATAGSVFQNRLMMAYPLSCCFRKGGEVPLLWFTFGWLLWAEGQLHHHILVLRRERKGKEKSVSPCKAQVWPHLFNSEKHWVRTDSSTRIFHCAGCITKLCLSSAGHGRTEEFRSACDLQLTFYHLLSASYTQRCDLGYLNGEAGLSSSLQPFNCWTMWRDDWCAKGIIVVNYCPYSAPSHVSLNTQKSSRLALFKYHLHLNCRICYRLCILLTRLNAKLSSYILLNGETHFEGTALSRLRRQGHKGKSVSWCLWGSRLRDSVEMHWLWVLNCA